MQRNVNPMDPQLIAAWNKGREAGVRQEREQETSFAVKHFMKWINRLEEVPGVGEKTTEKIRLHFLECYEQERKEKGL